MHEGGVVMNTAVGPGKRFYHRKENNLTAVERDKFANVKQSTSKLRL